MVDIDEENANEALTQNNDVVAEHDPVPVHPIDPVDPNTPLDEDLAVKKNFVVTLKYPATSDEVEAGCSATYLQDGDLTLPIRQMGGDFRFRAQAADSTKLVFNVRVVPTKDVLSEALLFLVQVSVPDTHDVQIGFAYGRVRRSTSYGA